MSRPSRLPSYPTAAHASGQARIYYQGRHYYLGVFGTDQSRQEYRRLIRQFTEPGAKPPPPKQCPTVGDICARWLEHCATAYQEDSREPAEHRAAVAVLVALYRDHDAGAFGTAELGQVREAMASGSWKDHGKGWCLNVCNRQIVRLRTMWRWAEESGLVPRGSWHHLLSLRPLTRVQGRVRQTKPRKAVAWEAVEATLPHLPPIVAAMVQLQWWTGMRPSEVCRLVVGDVADGPDGCLVVTLARHKTEHLDGSPRVVVVGAEGKAVLLPWLEAARRRGPKAIVFSTCRGGPYTQFSYAQAVRRGCRKAGVPVWHSYSLRHSFKARATRECGLDAARSALGQRSLGATNLYAREQDRRLAEEVARKIG